MRRTTFAIGVAAAILLSVAHDSRLSAAVEAAAVVAAEAEGEVVPGWRRWEAVAAGAVAGPYGGSAGGARSSGTVVGPAGGAGSGTRSSRLRPARPVEPGPPDAGVGRTRPSAGTEIDYAGAGRGGTTPGGVDYGKGVGGVQVTTPGGKEVNKVGTARGAAGPGGNAVGSQERSRDRKRPRRVVRFRLPRRRRGRPARRGGRGRTRRRGDWTGRDGLGRDSCRCCRRALRGRRGRSLRRTRSRRYLLPIGRRHQQSGLRGPYRTSAISLRRTRSSPPRWLGPTWRPITWGALAGFAGYSAYAAEPLYYDYGESVVYEGDTVYMNGEEAGTVEQYTQQAATIADTGVAAKPDPKMGEWQSLGVFAMVAEGETKSTNLFQLAVNKEGMIAGEYYNALTDETLPVFGSVGEKSQVAAWRVADKKFPVYEAGIANLTKEETTMIVHYSKEKYQQFTLVRLQKPEGEPPPEGK